MTTRQYILDILDDSPNREELLFRLIDLVESETSRHYSMGEKSGRIGASHDELVARLTKRVSA